MEIDGIDGTRTRDLLRDRQAFITAAWNLNLPFCFAGTKRTESGLRNKDASHYLAAGRIEWLRKRTESGLQETCRFSVSPLKMWWPGTELNRRRQPFQNDRNRLRSLDFPSRNNPRKPGDSPQLPVLAKTRPRVMRQLFQASIHDEDHPERPWIGSGNLLAAVLVVMDYPVREQLAQMLLVEWDDEIQTLPANGSHQTFTIGVRGGRPHRRSKYFESESPECVVQSRLSHGHGLGIGTNGHWERPLETAVGSTPQ